MAAARQFGLLGPLTVRCRGVVLPVAPGHQRAVLAALLLGAGRVVPVGELTEVLWGSAPPVSARVSVQNYVRRLRRALEAAGPDLISTQPGGYLITPAAGELDVTRFETLVRSARAAARAGSWADAAGRARAALTLWRGEPLADIGSDLLVLREVPRLSELRLQALEARIEADLQLGRPAEVAAELQGLTASHPLRERLYALLMLALYRDGRQGEALAAYRQARRVLAEELGAEPGTGLRELHQRMLAADPSLTPPAAAAADPAPAPGPDSRPDPDAVPAPVPAPEAGRSRAAGAPAGAVPVPRQLPGSVPHFAGRAADADRAG